MKKNCLVHINFVTKLNDAKLFNFSIFSRNINNFWKKYFVLNQNAVNLVSNQRALKC